MNIPFTRRLTGRASLAACAALTSLGLLGACASTPPPTAEMAVSTAALARAASAGSNESAPTEMRTAREKLERANQAMTAKDYDRALALAKEVQVDARLAEARTDAMKAKKAADAVQEGSRALSEELERKAK